MKPDSPILLAVLTVVWVVVLAATPRITPPGQIWTLGHGVALVLVVAGGWLACWASLGEVGHRKMFAFGLLSALAFLPVLLPDNRDRIGISMGNDRIEWYLLRTVAFVVGMALGCAILPAAYRKCTTKRAATSCRTCGYILLHLPEPRCPECGTPFDPRDFTRP